MNGSMNPPTVTFRNGLTGVRRRSRFPPGTYPWPEATRCSYSKQCRAFGDARGGPASVRRAGRGSSLRTLETLVDRAQVFDLARLALGLAPVGHDFASLMGRGMNQAPYTITPRKTTFMIPKFAARTL